MTTVNPLSADQYTKCFKTFSQRTEEYTSMLKFLKCIVKPQSLILSIGARSFNRVLQKELEPDEYYTLESHLDNIPGMKCFTPTTHFGVKFDYIIMCHSLYFTRTPRELIEHALTFLKSSGQLIIFHQMDTGICNFVNKWNKPLNFTQLPLAFHDYDAMRIKYQLNDVVPTMYQYCSYINLSEVFAGDVNITNDLLSFFLQTDVSLLPGRMVNEMVFDLKRLCVNNYFPHPVGVLVINGFRAKI